MKPFLDRFILGIPHLFIKQFPYAWFPGIVLWNWPPTISAIFFLIIALGLVMLQWQPAAWMAYIRSEYAGEDGKFYVDRPTIPWVRAVRNISLLILGGALIAYLLKNQIGLTFWQIFLIILGFTLTYQDWRFFGTQTIYIITASGIAVYFAPGHLDYRLFLRFKDISRIEQTQFEKENGWDFFARTRDDQNGLLLIPKDPKGFTKRMERLFIVPKDIENFITQLPYGYK